MHAFLLPLLAFSGSPLLAFECQGAQDGYWRESRWGAANGLFMLLRSHGVDVSYRTAQQACGPVDTESDVGLLLRAARELKCHILLRTPSLNAMAESALPVLCHLDALYDSEQDQGRVVMVYRVEPAERRLLMVDCISGLDESLGFDDFLRIWSGATLELVEDGSSGQSSAYNNLVMLLAIGAALLVGAAQGLRRWRRQA